VITPTQTSKDDTQVFPNLTLRHEFSDRLIGRVALTRGINRPNHVDMVPRITENQDGAILRVSQGNPDLDPTLSNNFDAGLHYFLPRFGVIGANVFYKDLQDYRYDLTLTGSYNGAPAQITRPETAPEGHIVGIEIDWRQQFDFLPGFASNLGVLANATFTDAEIKLGRTYAGRSKFPLPGQSDTSYNIALFYDDGALNARLSYTKRSDYLNEINADDSGLDLYWEGRGQLDFTAGYSFAGGKYEAFVEAKNLSNTPGVRYYGSRERTYEYEKFGYSVFMGLRFRM
jgi:TonB-dependent receptor